MGQLKPARTAGYTEFLARLLCVDVSRRYGAEEALNDPWIRDSDWSESDVAEMLAALDDSKLGCADPLPNSIALLCACCVSLARRSGDLAEGGFGALSQTRAHTSPRRSGWLRSRG